MSIWQPIVVLPWQTITIDGRRASWFELVLWRTLPDGSKEYRRETDDEKAQQQREEAW